MKTTKTEKQIQVEKDGWREVQPRSVSPCDGCEMGFASYSHRRVDGGDYTKSENCHDTCKRLRNWHP